MKRTYTGASPSSLTGKRGATAVGEVATKEMPAPPRQNPAGHVTGSARRARRVGGELGDLLERIDERGVLQRGYRRARARARGVRDARVIAAGGEDHCEAVRPFRGSGVCARADRDRRCGSKSTWTALRSRTATLSNRSRFKPFAVGPRLPCGSHALLASLTRSSSLTKMKFATRRRPCGVPIDSGWNWTP